MYKIAENYFNNLSSLINCIEASNERGNNLDLFKSLEKVVTILIKSGDCGHKLIFIGNGASASISSHMATDFWKNCGIPALSFNDSSLLTCISNDYGYKHVFEKPIEMFAKSKDILFAISSSGRSENILRAVKKAKKIGLKVVTLSGFTHNNPLRKIGDINFYVPDKHYGYVEIVHTAICHCLVDIVITNKGKRKVFVS